MHFTKVQGAGNDFILIEAAKIERDWSHLAKLMCDRRFGVGGDGLLLLLPSKVADFRMRIFNADGSEAEMCGNGIRCLARYIIEKGLVNAGTREVSIETMAGIRQIKLQPTGKGTRIQVSMGKPKFGAKDIPVKIDSVGRDLLDIKPLLDFQLAVGSRKLALSLVSMGNPHAVYFTSRPIVSFPLSRLGPKVEWHESFPNRTNFEVARVINRSLIEARVWERGAGETLACGTGACAIAIAAQLLSYVDNEVDIKLPGGILNVEWDGKGEVFLSGSAEIVFTGEWLAN